MIAGVDIYKMSFFSSGDSWEWLKISILHGFDLEEELEGLIKWYKKNLPDCSPRKTSLNFRRGLEKSAEVDILISTEQLRMNPLDWKTLLEWIGCTHYQFKILAIGQHPRTVNDSSYIRRQPDSRH